MVEKLELLVNIPVNIDKNIDDVTAGKYEIIN